VSLQRPELTRGIASHRLVACFGKAILRKAEVVAGREEVTLIAAGVPAPAVRAARRFQVTDSLEQPGAVGSELDREPSPTFAVLALELPKLSAGDPTDVAQFLIDLACLCVPDECLIGLALLLC